MTARTIIEQLADFAAATTFDDLPDEVVEDSERVLLDSVGCALAGIDVDKGRIGREAGRLLGGTVGGATIFGTSDRSTPAGAAFANAESINALDYDSVLPPGHVAPYVLPAAIAIAEEGRASGRDLARAIAVAHEISFRFGKSMDYLRTPTSEGMRLPSVLGFTSTVFGATAAICMLRGDSAERIADALGIAAAITPVNSYRTWMANVPNSSIKYSMPGPVATAALTAAYSAALGHSGDRLILDDAEFGYREYIGSRRWAPENLTDGLGRVWGFPAEHSYKPYPHCRVLHAPLDALGELIDENEIRVDEIDAIRCWGEGWVEQPIWLQRTVARPHQAQFSIAHGLAVGAHRLPPGPEWQTPETIANPSVLALMEKVTFAPHPDYLSAVSGDLSARPTRVEIDARGRTFASDRSRPKGTPSDPATYMSTSEIEAKFRANADPVLTAERVDALVDGILHLGSVADVRPLVRATSTRDDHGDDR